MRFSRPKLRPLDKFAVERANLAAYPTDDEVARAIRSIPKHWAKAIITGVTVGATTYVPGDETALEAVLTQAQVTYLLAAGAITGDWTPAGGGASPAAVIFRLAGATPTEGLEVWALDEIVTLTNAVKTALAATIPAGAVIICAQANIKVAVTGDASGDNGLVKIGIGIDADPDKYGLSAVLTKNAKIDKIPAHAVLSGAETVGVYAVDTAGAAVTEKFVAGGEVRVRFTYHLPNSLDNVP
jgi:hypothetical protein